MSLQTITAPPEMRPASAEIEQKVILNGVSWDTYQRLLAEHQESSGTHFAYDRGMLEIMVLSAKRRPTGHNRCGPDRLCRN